MTGRLVSKKGPAQLMIASRPSQARARLSASSTDGDGDSAIAKLGLERRHTVLVAADQARVQPSPVKLGSNERAGVAGGTEYADDVSWHCIRSATDR